MLEKVGKYFITGIQDYAVIPGMDDIGALVYIKCIYRKPVK
jgi:hypothetical protein